MKFLLIPLLCFSAITYASTISSVKDGNWEDASTWSSNQVPSNPDSIIVKHYVIVNQNFNISFSSVLFITASGTICGDYLMKTLCGAKFINYGHIFLGSIETRDGSNYNVIQSKNYISISGCSFATNGFYNYPPNGTVNVWPPVFCQTQDTNWEMGTLGLEELEYSTFNFYPNPITDGQLTVICEPAATIKVVDLLGNERLTTTFKTSTQIDFSRLSNGVYFLELATGEKKLVKKIIKTD
ncbi:MAG: T9SS type A sorting domain-containing protein [Bacteroidota bacterium]